MATTTTRTKKPAPRARRKTLTIVCPHCGEDFDVSENRRYVCPECEEYVDVDFFPVEAVLQPDDDTCGWATTKWLLKSFGALDVSDKELLRELNTKAKTGFRPAWNKTVAKLAKNAGWDWEMGTGTLPMALFEALSRRGITLKNPVRFERFSEYTAYLDDTFDAGGRAAMLLWGNNGFWHWMGIDRVARGRFRLMNPDTVGYCPLKKTLKSYEDEGYADKFLVFGFVRK
jgi:hypothetical protein